MGEVPSRELARVFLSYSRKDSAQALQVRDALRAQGLQVSWDQHFEPGESWQEQLRGELSRALIVVLWSENSVASEFVHLEAASGWLRSMLVPVRLSPCSLPGVYSSYHAVDVFDEHGALVAAKLSGLASRVAERIRSPRSRRRQWYQLTAAVSAIGLAGFVYVAASAQPDLPVGVPAVDRGSRGAQTNEMVSGSSTNDVFTPIAPIEAPADTSTPAAMSRPRSTKVERSRSSGAGTVVRPEPNETRAEAPSSVHEPPSSLSSPGSPMLP